jgi:hypothetical protein
VEPDAAVVAVCEAAADPPAAAEAVDEPAEALEAADDEQPPSATAAVRAQAAVAAEERSFMVDDLSRSRLTRNAVCDDRGAARVGRAASLHRTVINRAAAERAGLGRPGQAFTGSATWSTGACPPRSCPRHAKASPVAGT